MTEDQNIPPIRSKEEKMNEKDLSHFPEDGQSLQKATGKEAAASQAEQQQETEHMEVHHHSHSHGRKNWKSYFWEFLMLFLAVFCGFLAEYYLEHRIEKERGKQFIESFYEDLKKDTARTTFYTGFDEEKIKGLNNLGSCYDAIFKNVNDAWCLNNVIKHTAINRPFMRTDRTLKQLANAGGFRLLNKEDTDSILSYDKDFNNFQDFQSTIFQEAQNNVRNTLNTLANFKANEQMFRPQLGKMITVENFNREEVTAPLLFSTDKNMLNKYFNELQLYYRVTYNHKRMLLDLKEKQILLIEYFKNKYHFE
ncbi:MAG TPA: hypothetical protein VK616_11745 [Flavitalea sp.]|nr:hypothetical protein [Flavitalea sp.]